MVSSQSVFRWLMDQRRFQTISVRDLVRIEYAGDLSEAIIDKVTVVTQS